MKDIINKKPLQINEKVKIRKPAGVSSKYWDIAVVLSNYGGNFKKFPDSILKYQK
jgi:hypothetical protein